MALFGIDQLQEELDILSSKYYYRYVFVIGILTVIGLLICFKKGGAERQAYNELVEEPATEIKVQGRSNNARNLERA